MRLRSVLVSAGLFTLACGPTGANVSPEDAAAGLGGPEPVATPAVFTEVQSVQRPEPPVTSSIELDWREVDNSLSSIIPGERVRVDYDAEQPWFGAREPLVTIVVFVDYECPHCEVADRLMQGLLASFPEDVRVVARMYPLSSHGRALPAARAALAAHEQGKFEAMHVSLFGDAQGHDAADLRDRALGFGLDVDRFEQDMRSLASLTRIDADMMLGQAIGLYGVPTIYVNGRLIDDYNQLEQLVTEERVIGQGLVDAGAPRREVWARIMAASAPL